MRKSSFIPALLLILPAPSLHAALPPPVSGGIADAESQAVPAPQSRHLHNPNPTDRLKAAHLEARLVAYPVAISPGGDFDVGIHFKLEPGWHIYWKNAGDSGEPPHITWKLPQDLSAGEIRWPTPRRIQIGPLVNYGYEDEVLLPVRMHAGPSLQGAGATLEADVSWLVCQEECVPGKGRLRLTLPVSAMISMRASGWGHVRSAPASAEAPLFDSTYQAMPGNLPPAWKLTGLLDDRSFKLSIGGLGKSPGDVTFFPSTADQVEAAAPVQFKVEGGSLQLELKRSDRLTPDAATQLKSLDGVLVLSLKGGVARAYDLVFPLGRMAALGRVGGMGAEGIALPLLFAFLGGLLLNLMPCVFPVLSIKVMSIAKMAGESRARVIGMGWAYTLGILVSFWALVAALLALRYGGSRIGWGFQLQSPRFVLLLACILFAFGLNLLGFFEIEGRFMGWGGKLSSKEGYGGSFFTGVLATLVATPCTAPFMGSAVGYALSQPSPVVFGVFTALAVGLALPYLVITYLPGVGRILPRPGRWMETFKQAMSFLVFGTAVWLAWVLGLQASVGGVAILLSAFLGIGFAVWVASRWPKVRPFALLLGLLSVTLAVQALGHAPAGPGMVGSDRSEGGAESLNWEKFTPEKLREYRESGRPVFVDFTAAWCVSCQVNELLVFRSEEVRRKLKELGFALLKADWTNQDPMITETLASFGRSGVPFYVIYGKGKDTPADPLPEVINAGIVLRQIDKMEKIR